MPPFPNGWFQVAFSDEVAPGRTLPLEYFGQKLALFRTESGRVHVLDAFCAHLGAHLAEGGRVKGDTIVCPFHAWRFDGSGACVEVPYAKKVPARARVRAWPVTETNGMVMVWHHAEGKPPEWEVPPLPEYGSEDWTPYERRRWTIRVHNQEMGENTVDRAHFSYVHGTLDVPEMQIETEGAMLRAVSRALMHTPQGDVQGEIAASTWGFGFSAIRFSGIVDTLLVSSVTPIDEGRVDTRFSFSIRRLGNAAATRGVGAALIRDIEKQMSEDIPIWENKAFLPRPVLCDGDGPIAAYRRWCRQFYSSYDDAADARGAGEPY
jgi:nitrite reductase/ring-hydroxylating ferredoxin subunit